MRLVLAFSLLTLLLPIAYAADHPVSLTDAQETTLTLAAQQRNQSSAAVVQEAATVCLQQFAQQAQMQSERTLLDKFRQLPAADQQAVQEEAVKRAPKK